MIKYVKNYYLLTCALIAHGLSSYAMDSGTRSSSTTSHDAHARDSEGKTALHHAVIARNEKEVLHALAQGISINAIDNYGRTALHIAALRNLITMVELLLNHNPDTTIKDQNNRTALEAAELMKHRSIIVYIQMKNLKNLREKHPLQLSENAQQSISLSSQGPRRYTIN